MYLERNGNTEEFTGGDVGSSHGSRFSHVLFGAKCKVRRDWVLLDNFDICFQEMSERGNSQRRSGNWGVRCDRGPGTKGELTMFVS